MKTKKTIFGSSEKIVVNIFFVSSHGTFKFDSIFVVVIRLYSHFIYSISQRSVCGKNRNQQLTHAKAKRDGNKRENLLFKSTLKRNEETEKKNVTGIQWRKSNRMHFIYYTCNHRRHRFLSPLLFGMVLVLREGHSIDMAFWCWILCNFTCVCLCILYACIFGHWQSISTSLYSVLQCIAVNWKPLPIYRDIQMIFQSPLYSIPFFLLCSALFLFWIMPMDSVLFFTICSTRKKSVDFF